MLDNQTRKQQILNLLNDRGELGATVIESIHKGCGTEMRRNITRLRRDGYNISFKWEKQGNRRWKRYFLN